MMQGDLYPERSVHLECAHGCGRKVPGPAGPLGLVYCDRCDRDQCLVGPDGTCRYVSEDPFVTLSKAIDEHPDNAKRDREALMWGRVAKIGEELGEVIEAMLSVTGQNPRKHNTHTLDNLKKELLDVAITALCAYEHVDGHRGVAMRDLVDQVEDVVERWQRDVHDHGEDWLL